MTTSEVDLLKNIWAYRHGADWVLVETGQPHHNVRVGVGETLREAYDALERTPIQSVGKDCGTWVALLWADNAGWLGEGFNPDALERDDDAELVGEDFEERV